MQSENELTLEVSGSEDPLALEASVEEALAQLDRTDKQEFEEARETVPELVNEETEFLSFLRFENFDPDKAAKRIATYWKFRKIVFQERWLLPLNQTGTGALSMEDIALLRTGFYIVFPRPHRGPLLLLDESRLPRPAGDANFRILFYLDKVLKDEPSDSAVLHVVSSRPRPAPDLRQHYFQMIKSSVRISRASFFVAQAYEEGKNLLVDYLGYQAKRSHEHRSRVSVGRISANSRAGTLRLLEAHGFDRQYLPHCLGGDYDYRQFAEWIRMRTTIEDVMSSTPLMVNRLPSSNLVLGLGPLDAPVQRRVRAVVRATSASTGEHSEEAEDAESKAARTRQRNALYSRRSNRKRELTLLSLQDQERLLRTRNETIRNDNARLEQFLAMAQQYVAYSFGQAYGTPK